jgi:hypothetical protein
MGLMTFNWINFRVGIWQLKELPKVGYLTIELRALGPMPILEFF